MRVHRCFTHVAALVLLGLPSSCKDDGGSTSDTTTTTTSTTGGSASGEVTGSSSPTEPPTTAESGESDAGTTSGNTEGTTTSPTTDTEDPQTEEIYSEQFEGPDGDPWPAPWQIIGDQITLAELSGGRARYSGNTANVGRIALEGFSETDVDIVFTLVYESFYSQGVGFYARQNGGALEQTDPPGQGYAVYVEGGFQQLFGIWRETNGVEEYIDGASLTNTPPEDGAPYRIRFQCFTEGGQTRLRGRMWAEGDPEPNTWLIDILDDTEVLQGTAGSFAVDIYNYSGTSAALIDDVVISRLTPG